VAPIITLLIDSLGPGGAERQLCMLANGLMGEGYDIRVICYHRNPFYEENLLNSNIPVKIVCWRNGIDKILKVCGFLRKQKSYAVISFLKGANMLNILSLFPYKISKAIVSERNTDSLPISLKNKICFFLYKMADAIVVNSRSEFDFLSKNRPRLISKIYLIHNCVDLERFAPRFQISLAGKKQIKFGIFANYSRQKRVDDLILAVKKISEHLREVVPKFIWHGEYKHAFSGNLFHDFELGRRMISEYDLEEFFDLRGPTLTPEKAIHEVDCLCLTSEREGFPNSICEAFASGKPVVATKVGDIPYLLVEGVTGYLAEPKSSESIAEALLKMMSLSEQERLEMGKKARRYAELNLSPERFLKQYLSVISSDTEH
jgi:glycosyltransferase involved in cell wall biosynthesis